MTKNTVIFDMDGVLIDSEPFWRQAQIAELAKYNVTVTADDCIKHTMGRKLEEIAHIWCQRFALSIEPRELQLNIMHSVIALIKEQGTAMPGLNNLLKFLKNNNFNIALATSSSLPVIEAVLARLSVTEYFQVICSGDKQQYGKPHPGVYLSAVQQLQVTRQQCVVIEDSVTGMISAKAAAITTYVMPEDMNDPKFSIADGIFSSLEKIEYYLASKQS